MYVADEAVAAQRHIGLVGVFEVLRLVLPQAALVTAAAAALSYTAAASADKSSPKTCIMDSAPQPMSTPTIPGTILSVMVIVVPIVQPMPAWTSGIMRILQPAKAG